MLVAEAITLFGEVDLALLEAVTRQSFENMQRLPSSPVERMQQRESHG